MIYTSYAIAQTNNNELQKEALLREVKLSGVLVYTSCIVIPPTTVSENINCANLYLNYTTKLEALNMPLPLSLNKELSPYSLSPYDICRYEITKLVFNEAVPHC
jgi:hypothetical protein